MNELTNQIEELYFLGGNLQEILRQAKNQGFNKKPHKEWTTLEIRKAKEMREMGYTYKEIAENLGRNPKQVSQKLYREVS